MVRVVCEYCQTVYNIPDSKLTKEVSQATCKVCQNKIVIRRDPTVSENDTGGMSAVMVNNKGDLVRPAAAPSSTRATAPPPEDFGIAETELSNSWREAIVDNRETIQMLKKVGVPVPHESATAAGPKVNIGGVAVKPQPSVTNAQMPVPSEEDFSDETDRGDAVRVGAKTTVAEPRERPAPPVLRTTPPAFTTDDRGASALVAAAAGAGALIAAAGLAWGHGWAAGLSGLFAFAATSFAAGSALATAALRRRSALGILGAFFAGALVALVATVMILALHRDETRALLEAKPALAPLAKFF